MNRRSPLAALAAVATALVCLTGCGALDRAAAGGTATDPQPTATGTAETAPTSDSGLGDSVKDSGDIPDPCSLLTEAQVVSLTGRKVTQLDEDGEDAGAETRFCQWQQSGGQLAVFLSRTTAADFKTVISEAVPVDGIGEDAFQLAGHLYVLYGTVSIDVYSRGDSDEENLEEAKAVTKVLLPKI
jgi:hypothetical protein